ncbi:MAG TPA: hypothetical protein VHK22_02285 [Gaiellaceae bacterium]|jgi:hypothetical protein|nr:hypothetical protein [Gaiellaceae bacterium]
MPAGPRQTDEAWVIRAQEELPRDYKAVGWECVPVAEDDSGRVDA